MRVHLETEPGGLCDLVHHEASVRWIVENQLMETLVEQEPATGAIGPRLAEAWGWTDRKLSFRLRDGVRFHDGHALTSADVAFTLERARDPALAADQRSDLVGVTRIDTPDARTIELTVPAPAPFLLQAIAHLAIYPRHLLQGRDLRTEAFCRAPVGSGPYRFGKWESGVSLTLERVPAYWGARPHLDQLEFRFVRDRQAAWLLYRRGELDVLWRVPAGQGPSLASDAALSGHRIYRHTPRAFFFLVWNTRRPALARADVRAALGRLVDLPRLVQVAFDGHARPQSGPYVAGTPSYDEGLLPWQYEPAAAKIVLDAQTPPLRELVFLSTVGAPAVEQLATLLEEDLRRVGVTLRIEKLDFSRVLERLRTHDFDVAALQLTLALEQDNFGLFHSSAVDEQNWAGYSDAETDRLLERIRATESPEARHLLDRQLHRRLHDAGPLSFLLAPEVDSAVAPGIGGVSPSADGFGLSHAYRVKAGSP